MLGRDAARRVIDKYGTNDLKVITRGERLDVKVIRNWQARFDDFFIRPLMLIPGGIDTALRRTIIGHSLGHHFLHDGNQIWLRGFDRVWNQKQERPGGGVRGVPHDPGDGRAVPQRSTGVRGGEDVSGQRGPSEG